MANTFDNPCTCTICGLALNAGNHRAARTCGDCWPVCSVCAGQWKSGARISRSTLIRRLYAAGRSISACAACGAGGGLEVHFIKPLARGGSPESGNLLLLCPDCHAKVHAGARIQGPGVEIVRRSPLKEAIDNG